MLVLLAPAWPATAAAHKSDFEMRLRLSCDGSWVECSADLELLHSGRAFVIAVDPTKLAPGLHYTSIEGERLMPQSTGNPSSARSFEAAGSMFNAKVARLFCQENCFAEEPWTTRCACDVMQGLLDLPSLGRAMKERTHTSPEIRTIPPHPPSAAASAPSPPIAFCPETLAYLPPSSSSL